MTRLSAHLNSRDNNFNLIRMLSAIAVIFSHSFILAMGPQNGADPLARFIGMPISALAVNIFFITSGMLVTKSLVDRKSITFFLVARGVRIFPGLIIAVLFSTYIVGAVTTELNLFDYILHSDTFSFVKRNIWLFDNVIQYSLPGVFEHTPYKYAVNGSLWTLPWEIYSYISVLLIYIVLKKHSNIGFFISASFLFLLYFNGIYRLVDIEIISPVYLKLLVMFYSGVLFYLLRDKILISWFILVLSIVLYYLVNDYKFSKVLFPIFITYWTVCFAYLIKGGVLRYNKLGDLSYGTYIYAFPVQQALVYYFLPSGWILFWTSTAVTLIFAYISWHYIEKKALAHRDRCIILVENVALKVSSWFLNLKGNK
ncbi:acyltransferase family protein [Vibrio sp. TBV020]|uniref:acyltransferase family protein n=1 Tax=Vibrio sp. TBV020 TaxID=3137398 RepID=UPI0038CD68D2